MATSTAQQIATIPVYDYVMNPGDPTNVNPKGSKGKKVKVTLSYAQSQSASPVTLLGTDPVIVETDPNGFWQVNLVPNNKISPNGTIYTVEVEGNRSYVIQVTDVNAPGIGWQSSAIAVLPPISGGVGYTLPGGTEVLGALQVDGNTVMAGSDPWFDVTHPTFGAKADGVTDDGPAINRAITAASNAGGGVVWMPQTSTGYALKTTLIPLGFVKIVAPYSTLIKWTGATNGFMMASATVGVLDHFGMQGLIFDAQNTSGVTPVLLYSSQLGRFEDLKFQNVGPSGTAAFRHEIITPFVSNPPFHQNSAFNSHYNLQFLNCWTGLQISGQNLGTVQTVTLNFFYGLKMSNIHGTGIRFVQWADSNDFFGTEILMDTNNAIGIIFNDSATPAADVGVYNEKFYGLAIDGFSVTGLSGLFFNVTKQIIVQDMYHSPVTFNGTLINDNAGRANSYWVMLTQDNVGDNNLWLMSKGMFADETGQGQASLQNSIQRKGALTGATPAFVAAGLDANIGVTIQGKGTGIVNLAAQMANYIAAVGATTGNAPAVAALGSDTNVSLQLQGQGTGSVSIASNRFNFVNVAGGNTGISPNINALGGDANISLTVQGKGTGGVYVGANQANFFLLIGAATGNAPAIQGAGSDTNVNIQLGGQGTGTISLGTNFANFLNVAGAAAASAPVVSVLGSDTNIDLTLRGKGTGMVNAGPSGARLRIDSFGHLVSDSTGAPTTSNLGANVTSVTPTGSDVRGKLVIVMSGALAANTRIATVTYAHAYASAPFPFLINQTSGAGLTIVDFYYANNAAGSFDLLADQALATGTYECEYLVIG